MTTHGQNGYPVKYLVCKYCEKKYEEGFFGTGFKYCSKECQKESRKKFYRDRYIRTDKNCVICKRNIRSVGERKQANKYCSTKCMLIAQGIRDEGQKYVLVKIPVKSYYKLFKENKDVS